VSNYVVRALKFTCVADTLFGGNTGDLLSEVAGGPDYELFLQVERVT
jgi:hypothetical protein